MTNTALTMNLLADFAGLVCAFLFTTDFIRGHFTRFLIGVCVMSALLLAASLAAGTAWPMFNGLAAASLAIGLTIAFDDVARDRRAARRSH